MTRFPDGFLWGAATSAYQIEGSPLADGAGPSIWHRFTRMPGRVTNGDTGDVACDHYNRFREDVALLADLGMNAYRFSVSWSRVMPEGRGRVNEPGLDFYRRLVDALLARGIEPCMTLYHWDLPAALDERGGWLNRDIVGWFSDYAAVVSKAIGDRIPKIATLNEPWVVVDGGYLHGVHAPGHANVFEAPLAAHHLLLAHAAGLRAIRAACTAAAGVVVNLEPKDPASNSPEDLAATRRADVAMNLHYLDAVLFGKYPEGLREIYGEAWPDFSREDLAAIREPLDFLGLNYYTRSVVRDDAAAFPTRASAVPQSGATITETGWEVHPASLLRLLREVHAKTGDLPLYITENGAAFPDPPHVPTGGIEDPLRVDYFRTHLSAVREAIAQGVPVRGYFAWSLLDNFEWACGYSKRFGIVHVDFSTQKRTPKASAHFYSKVIRSRGESLDAARSVQR